MSYGYVARGLSVAVMGLGVLAGGSSASADTIAITQSAFSGSESVITFSNATDSHFGYDMTIDGVRFEKRDNRVPTRELSSGYYPSDRAVYFGRASDDGQFLDRTAQSNFDIIFSDAVNRIGMELATGFTRPDTSPTMTWFYEAFDASDQLLGTGSVTSSQSIYVDPWNVATGTGSVFLGFESSVGIKRVRMFEGDDLASREQGLLMDNLRFEASPAAVPLPAAAWAGFALMGGMGLVRKVRGRKQVA